MTKSSQMKNGNDVSVRQSDYKSLWNVDGLLKYIIRRIWLKNHSSVLTRQEIRHYRFTKLRLFGISTVE